MNLIDFDMSCLLCALVVRSGVESSALVWCECELCLGSAVQAPYLK